MAGSDDLATGGLRSIREQLIDLPLAKNLQVRIGLVQQEHRAGVRVHVCQKKQSLLEPPSRGGKVKLDPAFPVAHRDLATLGDVPRRSQFGCEQVLDPIDQIGPASPFLMNAVAEIAQDFGGSPFPHAHIDRPVVEAGLRGCQSGHRGKERDANLPRRFGHGHPLGVPVF